VLHSVGTRRQKIGRGAVAEVPEPIRDRAAEPSVNVHRQRHTTIGWLPVKLAIDYNRHYACACDLVG